MKKLRCCWQPDENQEKTAYDSIIKKYDPFPFDKFQVLINDIVWRFQKDIVFEIDSPFIDWIKNQRYKICSHKYGTYVLLEILDELYLDAIEHHYIMINFFNECNIKYVTFTFCGSHTDEKHLFRLYYDVYRIDC